MGARLSTIPENRSSVVTATAVPAPCPPAYNKPAANRDRYRWSNNYNDNRVPAAPVCATLPPSYSNPSNNNNFMAPSFSASRVPSVVVNGGGDVAGGKVSGVKAADNKEVIAFHSSTKWKEYFEASKQSNKLVVIYFTATWCGPCRYMEPTIKEIAAKYSDVDVVKIDVDELFNVSCEYGVQAMPTFLLMKKGKQIDKIVGARKEDLQNKVEKHRA
ncbi:thioredoxin H-type-like [Chenopodium quinoa]|uniref:Thioredoxin domain-containing protein n=1 Tax=Chenopodium quinoa TaxID=63459 RepID=A0A803MBK2_CHEQI|nr:thioredoxin H-type-like [Chenopodium quinoa]